MSTETDSADSLVARANKLELLERVADDLAHEIKNPLHSMVINLEVLKRRAARCGPEEAEPLLRYAGVIAAELDRLSRRVDLLLRFTRPARRAESASAAEIVEELLELIRVQAARRDVQLRYEPDGCAARGSVVRDPFQQIVLNLVHEVLALLGRGDTLELRFDCDAAAVGIVLVAHSTHPVQAAADRLLARLEAAEAAPGPAEGGDSPLAVVRALAESLGARIELASTGRSTGAAAAADVLEVVLHLPVAPR